MWWSADPTCKNIQRMPVLDISKLNHWNLRLLSISMYKDNQSLTNFRLQSSSNESLKFDNSRQLYYMFITSY